MTTTLVTINVYDSHAEREREVKFYGHTYGGAWDAASTYLSERPYLTRVQQDEEEEWVPEVTCSICDGIGHGQPGYGPCPLEDNGYFDPEEDAREREAQYWDEVRREEAEQAARRQAAAEAAAEKAACKHPYYHERRKGTFVPGAGVEPSDLIEHICSSCGEKVGQHFYHGRAWNE